MNKNKIVTTDWSNIGSRLMYQKNWPDDPSCQKKYEASEQCGGCAFFAPFNGDWGLCCNDKSQHHLETVFEHFTCPAYVREGSFTEMRELHCQCGGGPFEPKQVIELEHDGINYQLTRLSDGEYFESRNNSIAIADDFLFAWSLERYLEDRGLRLNLAPMYVTLKTLCGESSGCFFDDSKGSFSFPFSLEVGKGDKNFFYLLNITDCHGSIDFRIRKLIEPDDDTYDNLTRMTVHQPFEDEFSGKEIHGFLTLLHGYLAGFFKTVAKSYDEFFFKRVGATRILYGYKDGCFFEGDYESVEEYKRMLEELEKMKRQSKKGAS